MYLLENTVLQRELLVNLRMGRAFALLAAYVGLLGLVVYLAWPSGVQLDLTTRPEDSRALVNLFFLGQYVLASLMAPSFAAGAITGEKERKTYEMLLASPMRPGAIVLGKLLASLAHVALLIFASLPIVMLCIPLGGVSTLEVLAAYLALILSVATFGMISLACSSYFQRTAASLVVSYLIILPLAMLGVLMWQALSNQGALRLMLTLSVLPVGTLLICGTLLAATSRRLLHPPDVGSEGNEVVDLESEQDQAVGMVIRSDQFPDWLFAPAKRNDLMEDGQNPVYDKEMRSELFSQGTLMLRVVIQVSMFLAIPLMAFCLYMFPQYAAWYISYVILFNMLVGPVFSADRVTGERERQTLDLLLTTIISPWQILWGKLVSGLRVSSVLTLFLVWPVLLACVMVSAYWTNLLSMLAYLAIILLTCLTTATLALFCSVVFRKTSISLMTTYLLIALLFLSPLAGDIFVRTFSVKEAPPAPVSARAGGQQNANQSAGTAAETASSGTTAAKPVRNRTSAEAMVRLLSFTSPISAARNVPLYLDLGPQEPSLEGDLPMLAAYFGFTVTLNVLAFLAVIWLFNVRWRVSDSM
jgi:ABC-type transport system involved in multi-copper enzyme maturation permease subunit